MNLSDYPKSLNDFNEAILNAKNHRAEYFSDRGFAYYYLQDFSKAKEDFVHSLKTEENEMRFEKRSRRPPENRVNALLSFAYMLLKNDMQSALESVGLDPAAGYLHTLRPGRPSLALDIMEELRSPLCDRFVISFINLKQIKAKDFNTGDGVYKLSDDARRLIIKEWQQRKKEIITHPFLKEKIPIGLIPYCQSMLLARYIRGDIDGYPPFIWRY